MFIRNVSYSMSKAIPSAIHSHGTGGVSLCQSLADLINLHIAYSGMVKCVYHLAPKSTLKTHVDFTAKKLLLQDGQGNIRGEATCQKRWTVEILDWIAKDKKNSVIQLQTWVGPSPFYLYSSVFSAMQAIAYLHSPNDIGKNFNSNIEDIHQILSDFNNHMELTPYSTGLLIENHSKFALIRHGKCGWEAHSVSFYSTNPSAWQGEPIECLRGIYHLQKKEFIKTSLPFRVQA